MAIALFRPTLSDEATRAVADVLASGWIGLGPRTREFEIEFARYVGTPYCVGLSSCTAAVDLALRILSLPPGTEVITTPVTFVSTNHAILYNGLTPVFADVDRYTGSLSVESVASRMTDRTGALIVVHYGGRPADLDELYGLARPRGIPIIEDCAHACGATYRGRRIGSHGDLHAFSFHAVKNLPMGDGGALTVTSPHHDARLRRLRWLGIDKDTFQRSEQGSYDWNYDVPEIGFKCHMNDISAAIGLAQLRLLDAGNTKRAALAAQYRSLLSDVPGLSLPPDSVDRTSSHHLFHVLVERRQDLIDKLRNAGVGTGVHYRRSDEYPMYEHADLPGAEWFSMHTLSLPMHLALSEAEVAVVADLIASGW